MDKNQIVGMSIASVGVVGMFLTDKSESDSNTAKKYKPALKIASALAIFGGMGILVMD